MWHHIRNLFQRGNHSEAHYLSACSLLFLQVSGATGQLGVLAPRLVAWEEDVTELEHVKEEPRV